MLIFSHIVANAELVAMLALFTAVLLVDIYTHVRLHLLIKNREDKLEGAAQKLEGELTAEVKPAPENGLLAIEPPEPEAPEEKRNEKWLEELCDQLLLSSHPLELLRDFAHTREDMLEAEDGTPKLYGLESWLVRALLDAQIKDQELDFPPLDVVQPQTSNLFYFRVGNKQLPYLALRRILAFEAAINGAVLMNSYCDDVEQLDEGMFTRLYQGLLRSVASAPYEPLVLNKSSVEGATGPGEWAARQAFAMALECFQLPYRLSSNFRMNLKSGDVGVNFEFRSYKLMPMRSWIEGLGVVDATLEMRRAAADDYNMRIALLAAKTAFALSDAIERVWVSAVRDTGLSHECMLSVCFERNKFFPLEVDETTNMFELYKKLGIELTSNKELVATQEIFSLDDERFCPRERYEAIELSPRRLDEESAQVLGAKSVSDLGVDAYRERELLVEELLRGWGTTTAEHINQLLSLEHSTSDASLVEAARTASQRLIEGTLDDDALSLADVLLEGDGLADVCDKARLALSEQRVDDARELLSVKLSALEEAGRFRDTPERKYRMFSSYVERVIYNRLFAEEGAEVSLVSSDYVEALVLYSLCLSIEGQSDEALAYSRRALEVAPVLFQTHAQLAQCLAASGRMNEAFEVLKGALTLAYSGDTIAADYYHLAFLLWQMGDMQTAHACHQKAIKLIPGSVEIASALSAFAGIGGGIFASELSDEEVDGILSSKGIPLAPTDEIRTILFEAARTSLDAELFPVAKNFIYELGRMAKDDVLWAMLRSIEDAPDR